MKKPIELAELAFLNEYLIGPDDAFKTAGWLISDFEAPVWLYSLGFKKPKAMDWTVELPDGRKLTDPCHSKLLTGLKHFLILSTRVSGSYYSEANKMEGSQRKLFSYACHIIDLILISAKRYQIADHGLAGLTEGNLKEMLEQIASDTVLSESIYNWTFELKKFCIALVASTDRQRIATVLAAVPALSLANTQNDEDDQDAISIIDFPEEILPQIKAALYVNGYYIRHSKYGWAPSTILISEKIYCDTIWGRTQLKPTPELLCYSDYGTPFVREFKGKRVTTGKRGNLSGFMYADYRRTLYHLGVLHELGLPAPTVEALVEAESFVPPTSTSGRHRSLPAQMVFSCLRSAVEFHLDHGELLIDEYCRFALYCKTNGLEPSTISDDDFQNSISSWAYKFGIRTVGLSVRNTGSYERNTAHKGSKFDYFAKLRKNRGLLELVRIYIGAVQFVVGTLTARRVSELVGLTTDNCLDVTGQWLIFYNAKSTRSLSGIRNRTARPIEPLAVEMVRNLIRMHKTFIHLGYAQPGLNLFASPHLKGTLGFTDGDQTQFNKNLDFLCDYTETPVDNLERFYYRQHQLRRFFAMLFFYSKSFGQLDTLRWMLAHRDPSHVWRYITESTEGAVLQSAKSHYIAEQLHTGSTEPFRELASLLKSKYGTDDFRLIDSSEIENYIFQLLTDQIIEIEPEFFSDENGHNFKIVTKLKKNPAKDSIL